MRGKTPWPAQGSPDDPHGELCERQRVAYTCERGHAFEVTFAATARAPATWECRCGRPAGISPPPAAASQLQRRMTLVRQRRSAPDLEQLVADRLARRKENPRP